jgi:hypothetical protein
MVRYFIAAAAISYATSLVTRSEAAEQQIPRHLRKLYYTTSISATESVPTYYPTSSPTTEVVAETTSLVKTVTIKDDSWKCAAKISEVRNSSITSSLVTCSLVIQSNISNLSLHTISCFYQLSIGTKLGRPRNYFNDR